MITPYYREFYQSQGTVVQGTWAWAASGSQTDYASLIGEVPGNFTSITHANLDEYKWSNVYLTKGVYKITIVTTKGSGGGIMEVLFDAISLGTYDRYAVSAVYNQVYTISFILTEDTTADMRFRCNGKNASSSSYYMLFSRFVLEKTG